MLNRGDRKRQRARYRARMSALSCPPRQPVPYQCIDRNMSFYPAAFCRHYKAYLTVGLMETHCCKDKKCPLLKILEYDEKGIPTTDYFKRKH